MQNSYNFAQLFVDFIVLSRNYFNLYFSLAFQKRLWYGKFVSAFAPSTAGLFFQKKWAAFCCGHYMTVPAKRPGNCSSIHGSEGEMRPRDTVRRWDSVLTFGSFSQAWTGNGKEYSRIIKKQESLNGEVPADGGPDGISP